MKKMKNKKFLIMYIILTVLPLLITTVSMFFLPDTVPVHYGPSGAADRWGSRFELMIFPFFSLVIAVFMWVSAWFSSKNESSTKNNEKIVLISGVCILALFLILDIFFLYLGFNSAESIYNAPIDIGRLLCGFFGIFFVVSGNIMPKTKPNSIVGMRTKWSRKNENTWKQQQRVSGIFAMITGVVLIVLAFVLKGFAAAIAVIAITILMSVIAVVYSYVSASKEED